MHPLLNRRYYEIQDKATDTFILKTEQAHNCTAKYSDYGQDSDNQNRTYDECNYLFTIFITIVIQEAHSFMS